MVLTEFFQNILNVSGKLSQPSNVTFQTSAFAKSIKGTTFVTTDVLRPSIIQDSTAIIIENLKNQFFDVTRGNIATLAEISSLQTSAINELITVTEIDLKKIQEQLSNSQIKKDVNEEKLSKIIQEAKDTLSKLFDSLTGGLGVSAGTAAVVIGGIILLLVVKK